MDETLVDVGGHDNEIFLDLSKRERLEYTCSICRLILNQPQQCCNGHVYCLSCVKEWTRRGNKTCPTCGAQATYSDNTDLRNKIESKYVRCESSMCAWKGRLERLKHHVADSHHSSESSVSTERDTLSTDDRIEYHKVAKEVDKIHHLKKEVVQRRIKKMEKIKRQNVLDRQSAQTLPPLESNTSRSDYYRPLTDITDRKTDKLPAIALQQAHTNRGNFYQKLEDIENVKQKKREITRKKLEQIESRKVAERHSLYRKIQDIEQKQQENRYNSEQRILQIERKMREEKDAFQRKLSEKEKKNKDGHATWQRHISVIKVKMKNDKMTPHNMKSTIKP
ncbi:TNF receptor-associated factor 3-like [Mytilus californianus]|uniref:TNF receptor-associated factor 3-like n=1 Tax=Mytilus californianus TaxID=6549 RepID=UPI0022483223|nr:TNF receptor-associated factor 3-like [Mytilus californianus]